MNTASIHEKNAARTQRSFSSAMRKAHKVKASSDMPDRIQSEKVYDGVVSDPELSKSDSSSGWTCESTSSGWTGESTSSGWTCCDIWLRKIDSGDKTVLVVLGSAAPGGAGGFGGAGVGGLGGKIVGAVFSPLLRSTVLLINHDLHRVHQ